MLLEHTELQWFIGVYTMFKQSLYNDGPMYIQFCDV